MAHSTVTPEQFKLAKPQFAEVDDSVIQMYLDLSGLWVDDSWPAKLIDPATIAATCHLMTLDGLGSDVQSQSFLTGVANFQSYRSGELSFSRFAKEAGDTSFSSWLEQTPCGAFFLQLLRMAKSGPRIAMGGINPAQSGYAKDVPGSSIPGWWGKP